MKQCIRTVDKTGEYQSEIIFPNYILSNSLFINNLVDDSKTGSFRMVVTALKNNSINKSFLVFY